MVCEFEEGDYVIGVMIKANYRTVSISCPEILKFHKTDAFLSIAYFKEWIEESTKLLMNVKSESKRKQAFKKWPFVKNPHFFFISSSLLILTGKNYETIPRGTLNSFFILWT